MRRTTVAVILALATMATAAPIEPVRQISLSSADPDVAFNPARNEFGAVWEGLPPASRGITFTRYDAAGKGGVATKVSGDAGSHPRVAYDLASRRFLVVWERGTDDIRFVVARFIDEAGVPLTGEIQIAGPLQRPWGGYGLHPDVAATTDTSLSRFLVTWQARPADTGGESDIWSREVFLFAPVSSPVWPVPPVPPVPILSPPVRLNDTPARGGSPKVSFDPFTPAFFVVWEDLGGVAGRAVLSSMGIIGEQVWISHRQGGTWRPTVEFDIGSRKHLVVWQRASGGAQAPAGVVGQLFTSAITPQPASRVIPIQLDSAAATYAPLAVSAEHGGFLVAYRAHFPNAELTNIEVRLVAGPADAPTPRPQTLRVAPANADNGAAMATGRVYGWTLLIWGQQDGSPNGANVYSTSFFGSVARFNHGTRGRSGGVPWLWMFRPSSAVWFRAEGGTGQSVTLGANGDVPVLVDGDGDGLAEMMVWRPAAGTWSSTSEVVRLGRAGDIPVPGDYDGDGRDDLAVWRPSTGAWLIRSSRSGILAQLRWGMLGDLPVPGDYDGDSVTDLGVWRPSTGGWHTAKCYEAWWREDSAASCQVHPISLYYMGSPGDIPLHGDFSGDHRADYVVWQPRLGRWLIADTDATFQFTLMLGRAGDIPLPVDPNGDGRLAPAVWSPLDGSWLIDNRGGPDLDPYIGQPGDIPVGIR